MVAAVGGDELGLIPPNSGERKDEKRLCTAAPLQVRQLGNSKDGRAGAPQRVQERYKLNPAIFAVLKHMFEETYGVFLTRDVFSSGSDLKAKGFPPKICTEKGAFFINAPQSELTKVIRWLSLEKVLSMLVVPAWKEHSWHKFLEERAAHKFIVSLGEKVSPHGMLLP